ncbi:MAG: porin, partial [Gammaproteobacteria bacterium]|nr:porin [Gammaproteobacteria bacterium]
VYTWQITNYNGFSLLYEAALGRWDTSINLYYGSEESEDNDLLSLLFGASVDETWKNMIGIVGTMSNNWLELRLTHMQGLIDRKISGVSVINDIEQQFLGISVNLTFDSLLILSEFNNYRQPDNDVEYNAYLLSLGYQIGKLTPHITRSGFKQEFNVLGNDEQHSTTSVGLRWDVVDNIAVKVQYDRVIDEGVIVPVKGDSKSISLAVDFVF